MDIFLIIIVTVLLMGVSAYKGVRKTLADQEDVDDNPQKQVFSRPAFETLFDTVSTTTDAKPSFEQEEQAAGYFTYEQTQDNTGRKESSSRPQPAVVRTAETPSEESERTPFDLRQAIIYQTILNNKYNPEFSQS